MSPKPKVIFLLITLGAQASVSFFRFEAEIMKEWRNCFKDVS